MPNDAKDKVVPFFYSPENRTYHRIGEYLVNWDKAVGSGCKVAIYCVVWPRGSQAETLLSRGIVSRQPARQHGSNHFLR